MLAYPTTSSYNKMYSITWDGDTTTCWEETAEILEDGPWSPLYEYEDYVGIAHAIEAEELGLDEEDF